MTVVKGIIRNIAILATIGIFTALALMTLGTWALFAAGLACGAGCAVANYVISDRYMAYASRTRRKGAGFLLPVFRMLLYLAVFFAMTVGLGLWAGVGAAAGCLTGPVSVLVQAFLVPKIASAVRSAVHGRKFGAGAVPAGADGTAADTGADREYIYEENIRGGDGRLRYVFLKGSLYEMYAGGRVYATHRRFRLLKEIRVRGAGGATGQLRGGDSDG
jgi:hypothetical protein